MNNGRAEIYRAMADGKTIQFVASKPVDCSEEGVLRHILNGGTANLRVKPATVCINGFEVPEPMRSAPDVGTAFYYVDLGWWPMHSGCDGYAKSIWRNKPFDAYALKAGICHTEENSARIHAEALLSFTKI